jgi:hypothetical protein
MAVDKFDGTKALTSSAGEKPIQTYELSTI